MNINATSARHVFITGGARSGKSRFAETQLWTHFGMTVIVHYLASYDPSVELSNGEIDMEMSQRIAEHQRTRPQHWQTHEVKTTLPTLVNQVVILDCVSIFVANVLYQFSQPSDSLDQALQQQVEQHVIGEIERLLHGNHVYLVSNEVGCGLVPLHRLERIYRDILGRVNQRLAQTCDAAYCLISGCSLKLK